VGGLEERGAISTLRVAWIYLPGQGRSAVQWDLPNRHVQLDNGSGLHGRRRGYIFRWRKTGRRGCFSLQIPGLFSRANFHHHYLCFIFPLFFLFFPFSTILLFLLTTAAVLSTCSSMSSLRLVKRDWFALLSLT
jgi:hypothetical protein